MLRQKFSNPYATSRMEITARDSERCYKPLAYLSCNVMRNNIDDSIKCLNIASFTTGMNYFAYCPLIILLV